MDHMKLTDELRQQLMEAAVWKNDEIAARLDESGGEEEVVEVEDEEVEEVEEEVVEEGAHVCPLCVSQLDESIDEERILEHLNVVLGLVERLSQLNEGDEDIESVIDETIADILFADEEE